MQLREGQHKALIDGMAILKMASVAPYDALAIWQHFSRDCFVASGEGRGK